MNHEVIVYTEQDSKRYMWEGYNSLHKTLKLDQLPSEYYLEISKLFNGRTKEFFMHVVNRMIVSFRGYSMPTDKDFKSYIKLQKEADRIHELKGAVPAVRIECDQTASARVKMYEREAMEIFHKEYPQYKGLLAYNQSPNTEKERKSAVAYFKILKSVHSKHNPDGIFGTGANFKGEL